MLPCKRIIAAMGKSDRRKVFLARMQKRNAGKEFTLLRRLIRKEKDLRFLGTSAAHITLFENFAR
jgi:hypothetical protein